MDGKEIGDHRSTGLVEEKPSPSIPVTIGSPLTPIDGVELSTPNKPAIRRLIVDVNEGLDDEFDLNDALNYDSDGNLPPQATLMDSQHEEHELVEEIGPDDDDISVPQNIIILTDEQIKKLKVDGLKKELRTRGLSHAGKKAELVERLKKAMIDRIPIIDTIKMSTGPNGFHPNAKWRLLEASKEEVKEPECVDPTLVAPSEARYKRNEPNNSNNDAETATTPTPVFVKKFNYDKKFVREKFDAVALQLIENNTSTKKKQNKSTIMKQGLKKYDKMPIKSLIPNLKFTVQAT